MQKVLVLILFLAGLSVHPVFAQTSLKAEVDKVSIDADETLTYKLVINSSEKKVPAPQLPKFEGFLVLSQAHSSTVSFSGGEVRNILVYVFILSPKSAGKFKIEPGSIKIENDTYSSQAFEIEVKQGKEKPQPLPEQKLPSPEEVPQVPGQPQITL